MNLEEKQVERLVGLKKSTTLTTSLTQPTAGSETEDLTKPVALLVSHGMGQQVPFATLATLEELLVEKLLKGATTVTTVTHVRFLDPDTKRETWLARAELEMKKGDTTRTVHVYENYWAPLTEGNISLSETVRFMASAGWERVRLFRRGTRHMRRFQRWLFTEMKEFEVRGIAAWGLILALVLVMSLVVINGILTLVAGANLLGMSKLSAMPAKLVDYLTLDLFILLGVAGLAFGFLWKSEDLVHKLGKQARKPQPNVPGATALAERLTGAIHWVASVLLVVAGISLILVAFIMAFHYLSIDHELKKNAPNPSSILHFLWQMQPAQLQSLPGFIRQPDWAALLRMAFIGVVWAATVVVSLRLRNFLVQYMGDVAIYLDAYKVDKFHKVREEVKRRAYETACALYGARQRGASKPAEPLPFLYDRILMVGHSLGSVVAYDALNATLHLDESMNYAFKATERTRGLITFGSPLDKTAYIFATQTAHTSVRPPLTASVQSIILSTRVRHYVKWINIYSPSDIVSNKLRFYDGSLAGSAQAVDNREDVDARTPLAAHNQYWRNQALATAIEDLVFDARAKPYVEQS